MLVRIQRNMESSTLAKDQHMQAISLQVEAFTHIELLECKLYDVTKFIIKKMISISLYHTKANRDRSPVLDKHQGYLSSEFNKLIRER